jgi:NADH:ubiquinone oxidoreductase subunit
MDIGTRLFTWLRGKRVGQDAYGNRYYEGGRGTTSGKKRRWVVYAGTPEASKVPAEWHGWLHHTLAAPLAEGAPRAWMKPHQANLTGTVAAYRPAGSQQKGGVRARATGDYEAWSPE